MTFITAIVYSNPGCQPCRQVKNHLTKLGIDFEERSANAWAEYITELIKNYRLEPQAPLVALTIDGKAHYFTGNHAADLEAITYLAKEAA